MIWLPCFWKFYSVFLFIFMWEDMSGAAEDVELNWGSKRIHLSQISRWAQCKTSNIIKYQDELNICANIMGNPLSIFAQISNLSTILLSNIKENPIWAKYQDELNICANILGNQLSIFVHSFHFVNYLVFKYQIESNLSQISNLIHSWHIQKTCWVTCIMAYYYSIKTCQFLQHTLAFFFHLKE